MVIGSSKDLFEMVQDFGLLTWFLCIKGLLNGHLGSPQSKFQISNCHLHYRKLGFFSINTYICALNQSAHTSFSKMIFWKQIRMSSVLVYNWHETAVFTKYKHIIFAWINSLKYNAWQLSFQNVQNVSKGGYSAGRTRPFEKFLPKFLNVLYLKLKKKHLLHVRIR
jgi:hypothetical protein